MRKNKYNVAPKIARTSRDGIVFDSKGEMERWEKLKLWVLGGEIRKLRRQVPYKIMINGQDAGTYTADFVYEQKFAVPVSPPPMPGWIPPDNMSMEAIERIVNPPITMEWREVIEDFKGKMTTDAKFRIKVFEITSGKKVKIIKA